MDADTLLPENACRKEGYRRMYSVHLEQKPYIVPLPLMHIRLSIYLLKKEAPAKQSSFLNPESPVPLMYVWLNNRDGVEYMTWRWIYAACFISTIPSLYHLFCYQFIYCFRSYRSIRLCLRPISFLTITTRHFLHSILTVPFMSLQPVTAAPQLQQCPENGIHSSCPVITVISLLFIERVYQSIIVIV